MTFDSTDVAQATSGGRLLPLYKFLAGSSLVVAGLASTLAPAFAADDLWTRQRASGDWGGTRSEWKDAGIDLRYNYVSETATVLDGGYDPDRSARYSDQHLFGGLFDLDKLFGWSDAEFKITLTSRYGKDITVDRITDPRARSIGSSVQEIYGFGQTWRFTHLFYRQQFLDKKLDVKIGRMPMGDDVDVFGCSFVNLAFCGALAARATGIWFNWPISQYGLRLRWNFSPEWYAQSAVFAFQPKHVEHGNGLKFGEARRSNVYLNEIGYLPKLGEQKLPGTYLLGAYYSSGMARDQLYDDNGDPAILSGEPLRVHSGRHGAWLMLKQQVATHGGSVKRGPSLFLHLTGNDQDTARMDYQIQAGFTDMGLFDARPQDEIGFAVSKMHLNSRYTRRQELQNQLRGVSDYDDPLYQPLQTAEYAAELFYGYKPSPWLLLQPGLQYLHQPGGTDEVDDATVLSFKISATF